MAFFRRRRVAPYDEEEDRVHFRTDWRLRLRFLWIDLKHGVASRRPFRPLLARVQEWKRARVEARRTAPLPSRPSSPGRSEGRRWPLRKRP